MAEAQKRRWAAVREKAEAAKKSWTPVKPTTMSKRRPSVQPPVKRASKASK
jgi:hypothetical protein